jgi:hypothetical protein
MSISWTMPSMTFWSAGPPIEVRFAVVKVSARISAVFQGVMRNSWKSVSRRCRPHRGDLLVAVVVDVVGSAQAPALEPREHRLALVGLGTEVGRQLARWQGVEPDHLACVADNLRAARVAAPLRGDEDVIVASTLTGGA